MGDRAASQADQEVYGDALVSRCHGCDVRVAIRHGMVETQEGRRVDVTYADTDIVVWDCPACALANADELGGS